MKARDLMIILFTFATGIFAGMYFYVTSYKPIYQDKSDTDEISSMTELSIIGETYGGFVPDNYKHPTFRITSDGRYDYFEGGPVQGDKREGDLPKNLFNSLKGSISNSNLTELQKPAPNKVCASYSDGVEYEYSIKFEGMKYELDTCRSKFTNETELGSILVEVWEFLFNPDEYRFSISNSPNAESDNDYRGLRGYFEDGFKESGF